MRLAKIFGVLFVLLLLAYIGVMYFVLTSPESAMMLTVLLIPFGWGAGICFILFLVMFILKK